MCFQPAVHRNAQIVRGCSCKNSRAFLFKGNKMCLIVVPGKYQIIAVFLHLVGKVGDIRPVFVVRTSGTL